MILQTHHIDHSVWSINAGSYTMIEIVIAEASIAGKVSSHENYKIHASQGWLSF